MDKKILDDILIELRVEAEPEHVDGYYVVTLDTYTDFNRVYNSLEKSIYFTRDSENSHLNSDDAHIQYDFEKGDEEAVCELVALFDDDDYTLNIQG